jgi:SAM-dependent methyltransferase
LTTRGCWALRGVRVRINWKLKSVIFSAIDLFNAPQVLYFLQRHVTGRSKVNIDAVEDVWRLHRDSLESLNAPSLIEFGAGKNLRQNIYLSAFCRAQTVVDLFPMLEIDQFNSAARQISALVPDIPFHECASLSDIERCYGITYRAPFDMAHAPLDDNCLDCCVSTNTMEHLPVETLRSILSELTRVIRPGGLISAKIDYSDHYSHTDRGIGPLNFLSYTEEQWRKHNHHHHYQNRLRHYHYRQFFADAGLGIEYDEPVFTADKPAVMADGRDPSEPTVHATAGLFRLRVRN